jgi:hypothetical protein
MGQPCCGTGTAMQRMCTAPLTCSFVGNGMGYRCGTGGTPTPDASAGN